MPSSPEAELAIRLEVFIEAPPEAVWQIVSTLEGMRRWQGAQEYEPRVGGKLVIHLNASGEPAAGGDIRYISSGVVEVFDPPRTLAYTWRQIDAHTQEAWPSSTLVTLSLEAESGGTRVRVVHSGFESLPGDVARRTFEEYTRGWHLHDDLGKLKRLAEDSA